MKKILSGILCVLMLVSMVTLTSCGAKKEETLKFGMGVTAAYSKATSADGETNGAGEAAATVAAVLVDANGKIVKCVLDTADNTVNYTSEGKFVSVESFKTKYELGADYGMVAYGNATKEWYEQADAFAAAVEGKTVEEVKALVATDGKGTEAVVTAGCTITVTDFVNAVEKAVANAAASSATSASTLQLGVVTTQSGKDATEEANGENEVDTAFVAVALDADKKVVAAATDVVAAKFTFDMKGVAATDTTAALTSKKEAGTNYGMAAYGTDLNEDGKVLEWYEQAAAFDAALIGKTASEISALAVDTGYGVESLQTAGCTINVSQMVQAAVKAATVA